jgi:hypothetical protein
MPEGIELPEAPEERGNNPLVVPVSLTISILAVLVAAVTLLGHRAHTEELLLQNQATDRWTQYQAKSIRRHQAQDTADLLSVVALQDKEKAQVLKEKYAKELQHYESDKSDISEQAKELERERDLVSHRADRFDGGEALLEIALVICSITLLTKVRGFWIGGMVVAAAGVFLALTGLLLHMPK